jgi:hypothetical protein
VDEDKAVELLVVLDDDVVEGSVIVDVVVAWVVVELDDAGVSVVVELVVVLELVDVDGIVVVGKAVVDVLETVVDVALVVDEVVDGAPIVVDVLVLTSPAYSSNAASRFGVPEPGATV